ncbi:MAG: PF20097 family protein [Methanomassiliicoccales archaeon]|nr:PF20097 family protein [Methanomassiliicoccales archaeon]
MKCPKCNEEMELGYITSGYRSTVFSSSCYPLVECGIQWRFVKTNVEQLEISEKELAFSLQGYRCRKCRLIILRY